MAPAPQTLKLVQQTSRAPPASRPRCARSSDTINWPVTVTLATAADRARRSSCRRPIRPTARPPADNVFTVVGQGTLAARARRRPGDVGAGVAPDIIPNARRHVLGADHAGAGDAGDPDQGLAQAGVQSGRHAQPPVFVSVGIDPPTVEFPRNGAELDCKQPDQTPSRWRSGTIPYPQEVVRPPARVRGDRATGARLRRRRDQASPPPQPGPADPFASSCFNPGPGRPRPLLLPGARSAAAGDPERDATRTSAPTRVSPTRRPAGSSSTCSRRASRSRRDWPASSAAAASRATPPTCRRPAQGPFPINVTQCAEREPAQRCARSPTRTSTCASARGSTRRAPTPPAAWALSLPLPRGLERGDVRAGDRLARGRRLERELSVERDRPRRAPAGRTRHQRPGRHHRRRDQPAGREGRLSGCHGGARDRRRAGAGRCATRRRVPCSGSAATRCCARRPIRRPARSAWPSSRSPSSTVRPSIKVPPAASRRGDQPGRARIVSYDVTAFDAVDGPVAVDCAPSSPRAVPARPDHAGRLRGERSPRTRRRAATFKVQRRRHDAARRCARSRTSRSGRTRAPGAIVNFATCANDIVDGAGDAGLRSPVGLVLPARQDAGQVRGDRPARQQVAVESFTVEVGDTTPPVLKLPGTIVGDRDQPQRRARQLHGHGDRQRRSQPDGEVRRRRRARCSRSARRPSTARRPTPPETAAPGTFVVKVTVAWTGLLAPVNDGRQLALPARAADRAALRADGREREHLRPEREAVRRAAERGRDAGHRDGPPPACRRGRGTCSTSSRSSTSTRCCSTPARSASGPGSFGSTSVTARFTLSASRFFKL